MGAAINVAQALYLDCDGETYPITNWFDEDGDECPREDAVVAVAGKGGCWFSLVLADFSEAGATT